jgi:hypothetical protein
MALQLGGIDKDLLAVIMCAVEGSRARLRRSCRRRSSVRSSVTNFRSSLATIIILAFTILSFGCEFLGHICLGGLPFFGLLGLFDLGLLERLGLARCLELLGVSGFALVGSLACSGAQRRFAIVVFILATVIVVLVLLIYIHRIAWKLLQFGRIHDITRRDNPWFLAS